jgi:DNA modification methylase
MDSDTTGIAALKLKCQFIGIEFDETKFQITSARLDYYYHHLMYFIVSDEAHKFVFIRLGAGTRKKYNRIVLARFVVLNYS